jgi:hypothetical protein
VLAATILAAAGAGAWAETGATHMPPPGALVAPGSPADVTLLYTGDVIGYVDPCG